MRIDLNCDLGEGCPHDAELMGLITTASIACGFHAGDAPTARAALRLAARAGVQAGAHPGHPDRADFGRTELARDTDDVFADCVYQVGALAALARVEGTALRHLKPHGALYHQACREDAYARPVVEAAALFGLAVVGLPGSRLEAVCAGKGRPFVAEGFADRRYLPDGNLVPRGRPDAFVADPAAAARQALDLLGRGVRTLCVHGDNPQALAFVRALRAALQAEGVVIAPF
jgi:UPF0271 protein